MSDKNQEVQDEDVTGRPEGDPRSLEIKEDAELTDARLVDKPLPTPNNVQVVRPLGEAKALAHGLPHDAAYVENLSPSKETAAFAQVRAGVIPVEGDNVDESLRPQNNIGSNDGVDVDPLMDDEEVEAHNERAETRRNLDAQAPELGNPDLREVKTSKSKK